MKIVESIKEPQITFDALKVGDVFQVKHDPKYYMKTESYVSFADDPFTDTFYRTYRNTVCLSNGKIMKTNGDVKVFPIDCELIIK
jgi:hypothetical protein